MRTDPGLVAVGDQLGAALESLAPVLGTYRRALLAQGLTLPEVTALLVSYQAHLLGDPAAASSEAA